MHHHHGQFYLAVEHAVAVVVAVTQKSEADCHKGLLVGSSFF